MNFRFKLSKESAKRLEKAIKSGRQLGDLKKVQRCSAVLFLAAGNSQSTVARCIGVSVRTLQRWVSAFMCEGVKGLGTKKPKGRRPRLSKSQKRFLKEQLQRGPQEWGYETGIWTAALIQDHILLQFSVSYSVFYISQLLRNIGMSYIKQRHYYSQDPKDFHNQLGWIREEYPKLYEDIVKKGGMLWFQDESRFQLQSNLVKTWSIKGKPLLVERNPKRGSIPVMGAIELFSGKLTYQILEGKITNDVFSRFLKQLAKNNPSKEIYVVIDNAPYHQGETLRKFLKQNERVHLCRLPKRSPHLNPIEKLWKEMKRDCSHNKYFKSKRALEKVVRRELRRFQHDRDRVKSLMAKWKKVGKDPRGAKEGHYDSSFIPNRHKRDYDKARQEYDKTKADQRNAA